MSATDQQADLIATERAAARAEAFADAVTAIEASVPVATGLSSAVAAASRTEAAAIVRRLAKASQP